MSQGTFEPEPIIPAVGRRNISPGRVSNFKSKNILSSKQSGYAALTESNRGVSGHSVTSESVLDPDLQIYVSCIDIEVCRYNCALAD